MKNGASKIQEIILITFLTFFLCYSISNASESLFSITGVVVDDADILTNAEIDTISVILAEHNEIGPGNIFVLILKKIPEKDVIENYASQLVHDINTSVKSQPRNDTILFLVSINDRKMRIQVSDGIRGKLTSEKTESIINQIIIPEFKKSKYYAGILNGTAEIIANLTD